MNRYLLGSVLMFAIVGSAACAAPPQEDIAEGTPEALSDQPTEEATGPAPIVFDLAQPKPILNLDVQPDWSRAEVDILDRRDDHQAWIRAERWDDDNSGGSGALDTIRDQIDNGLGSGNCRLKLGLHKAIVNCSWRF